jgi:NAD(P)-dependent dehydrogenase (short-subunit alcohol dehydrogenase family)
MAQRWGRIWVIVVPVCDLSGQRALVVGASRGIGAAISRALADAGAHLALASRSVDLLEQLRAEIADLGRNAVAIPLDLRDEQSVNAGVARAVEALDHLDIVVDSGGVSPIFKRAEATTVEEWDTILDTNARGAFLLARAAGTHLIERGHGALIFVTSVHEQVGFERLAAYCASKGAVRMLARVLALEWAPLGVRVNCLAPAYVETGLTAGIRANPGLRGQIEGSTPLGRMAKPEEVAAAAVYLASDPAQYVTGTTLFLDGGWTAR